MIIVYGTKKCPDCVEAENILQKKRIEYKFIEITDSTANLKEFLALRDKLELFDEIKREGKIGVPCFVKSEEVTLDLDTVLK